MNRAEAQAWVEAAPREQALDVRFAVVLAFSDWLDRVSREAELHDLVEWSPPCAFVQPAMAACVASTVAIELAILVAVWPQTIDAALRRVSPRLR